MDRMNQPTLAKHPETSSWDPKFPFDLVVAYDDTATRICAMRLYDSIAQQLIDDYDFQCSWWKFEHLANPILQQEAADAAIDANMVILSLRPHRELPAIHKAWLDDWATRRSHRKAALVVMVADSTDPETDARESLLHLRNLARVGRMDFFLHGFELPKPSSDIPLVALPDRVSSLPPAEHAMWHHKSPVPRWGINE
jgi:hypothetical protein